MINTSTLRSRSPLADVTRSLNLIQPANSIEYVLSVHCFNYRNRHRESLYLNGTTHTVEWAATQLSKLALREDTGFAVFEGHLVVVCRLSGCGKGDTVYNIHNSDHVEHHGVNRAHKTKLKNWRNKVLELLHEWEMGSQCKGPQDIRKQFSGSNHRPIPVNPSFCRPQSIVFCPVCPGSMSNRAGNPICKCSKCGNTKLKNGMGQSLNSHNGSEPWWCVEIEGTKTYDSLREQLLRMEQTQLLNNRKASMYDANSQQDADTTSKRPWVCQSPDDINEWGQVTSWKLNFDLSQEHLLKLVTAASASMYKSERAIFLPVENEIFAIFKDAYNNIRDTCHSSAPMKMLQSLKPDNLSCKAFLLKCEDTHKNYVKRALRRVIFFLLRLRDCLVCPWSEELRFKLRDIWSLAEKCGKKLNLSSTSMSEEDQVRADGRSGEDDEDSDDDDDNGEEFPPDDELSALSVPNKDLSVWAEYERNHASRVSTVTFTDNKKLKHALNDLSTFLITEEYEPGKTFALRYLADALGYLKTPDFEDWKTPGEYSQHLPPFMYCIRLLIYARSRPMDKDEPGPIKRLHMLRYYTTVGQTPFSDLTRLLAVARRLGRDEGGVTSAEFVDHPEDGRVLELYHRHKLYLRIRVAGVTSMVEALLEEAMLLGSILAVCPRDYISRYDLSKISDTPMDQRAQEYFVTTNPALVGGGDNLGERWRTQRGLRPEESSLAHLFGWEAMRQRYLRVLFMLYYFSAGAPFRIAEALRMTLFRYGPKGREKCFQIHEGYLALITKVIKGRGRDWFVARFAPPLVGELFVLYFSEIRPFRANQEIFPENMFPLLHENLVWEEDGKAWEPESIMTDFKETTLKHLGVAVPPRDARQMMSAIVRDVNERTIPVEVGSSDAEKRMMAETLELQCGHKPKTGQLHSAILKSNSLSVVTSLFHVFFDSSKMMHKHFRLKKITYSPSFTLADR